MCVTFLCFRGATTEKWVSQKALTYGPTVGHKPKKTSDGSVWSKFKLSTLRYILYRSYILSTTSCISRIMRYNDIILLYSEICICENYCFD